MRPLFLKEWIKLRGRLAAIVLGCATFHVYFAMVLRRKFTLEHAEMVFYQVGRIGQNTIADFEYVPLVIGALLAFMQFAPEVARGHLRLSLHLPIATNRLILFHVAAGTAVLAVLFALNAAALAVIVGAWFPVEFVTSALSAAAPWMVAGIAAYFGGVAAMLEPHAIRRVAWLVVTAAVGALCHLSARPGAYHDAISGLVVLALLFVPAVPWVARRFRGGDGTIPGVGRPVAIVLFVTVCALMAPIATSTLFDAQREETQIFFSPVSRTFVFREHLHDHEFRHATREGQELDRRTFQTLLPFIYNRDMEVWGLLPVTIGGRAFDRRALTAERMIFELKPRDLADRRVDIAVHPLLESEPGQARLQFPEDIFRFSADRIEFLNVDTLAVDEETTRIFTDALKELGFAFPPRLVEGRATILKPFDDGYLVVDANGVVFHVKRAQGRPRIVRTPIPADLAIRSIQIVENAQRRFMGLLLTRDGRLFLIGREDYRLLPMPTQGYDPDTMDYRLIMNPVAPTAAWSNSAGARAAALTPDLTPFDFYARAAPERRRGWGELVVRAFIPFEIRLEARGGDRLEWLFAAGPGSAWALSLCLAAIIAAADRRRTSRREYFLEIGLTMAAGVFGLIAARLTGPARPNRRV
ncbi:DUF4857 domain-containing protein [Xanthobacteraceae bacterium Astr-EGSB]|uniref:DUF4857 domain-containing protein n=1 Tax=Astrobacterium formosum TaxID=3069710 RepID=UPI0027B3D84F|nr:DUF4857 domain-containing protein [Xanthobacteraceae bacterium Astr-EGSB]